MVQRSSIGNVRGEPTVQPLLFLNPLPPNLTPTFLQMSLLEATGSDSKALRKRREESNKERKGGRKWEMRKEERRKEEREGKKEKERKTFGSQAFGGPEFL